MGRCASLWGVTAYIANDILNLQTQPMQALHVCLVCCAHMESMHSGPFRRLCKQIFTCCMHMQEINYNYAYTHQKLPYKGARITLSLASDVIQIFETTGAAQALTA